MNSVVWRPQDPQATRMWQFMRFVEKSLPQKMVDYQQLHRWSVENPALFWQTLSDFFAVSYDTPATEILNQYYHMLDARWFKGANLNYAETLLARNVPGAVGTKTIYPRTEKGAQNKILNELPLS